MTGVALVIGAAKSLQGDEIFLDDLHVTKITWIQNSASGVCPYRYLLNFLVKNTVLMPLFNKDLILEIFRHKFSPLQ